MTKCDFCIYSKPNKDGDIVCAFKHGNYNGLFCDEAINRYTAVMLEKNKPERTNNTVIIRRN